MKELGSYSCVTNKIEEISFYYLYYYQQVAAIQLGFDEESCDCYQNHYGYYEWYEREEYELDTHWIELGYNQDSWEADDYDYPDTFVLSWAEITQAQQDAASEICYFQETWDMIPLSDWTSRVN